MQKADIVKFLLPTKGKGIMHSKALSEQPYRLVVQNLQLKGKQAKLLDSLVMDGIAEYKAGKCRTIKSLADLE